jgi:hypothetical protein
VCGKRLRSVRVRDYLFRVPGHTRVVRKPGSIYDKLFQAIVIVGAAAGASACRDDMPKPDATPTPDAQVADAPMTDAQQVDAIVIL